MADFKSLIGSSSSQIWKSKLSWRITLSVFATILVVQVSVLVLRLTNEEIYLLDQVKEIGRSAIVPTMDEVMSDFLTPPIKEQEANRLISTTLVEGFAIYTTDLNLLKTHGEPLGIMLHNEESLLRSYRSVDRKSYEVVYLPNDLRRPYIIAARLDASQVDQLLRSFLLESVMIMFLLSGFVTTVLMIALGHWLLEPILFLRRNLLKASENPENPDIEESPFNPNDEIGGSIEIAHNLIRQNALNIRQIKSAAEDQIHKLAYYDSLTGLPNKTLFLENLNSVIQKNQGDQAVRHAIIALDLDHFKDVNDSMGHSVGDAILRSVGKRLKDALPETAIVARTGEDEYAVMIPLQEEEESGKENAMKIASVIRDEPFQVFNESFRICSSIGVSLFPDDGLDADQILKNSYIALNRAKEEGRDTIKEYSEDFDRAVQMRFQLLRDLRDALEKDELTLHYQPQFDLKTGKIIGAEALIRWWKKDDSKDGGYFIPPFEFIPVAEQSGLIVPIGEWVTKTACGMAAEWHKKGHHIRIAVNVSGAQFFQSDICDVIRKILKKTKLPPNKLELEVTESVFMEDIQNAVSTLQKLHRIGVELAIDDFGTGYSSLSYLRQFPIDRLKIDQSFIRNALTNPDDASIARTIVRLGHSLNLKVIAEGVESIEHEEFLRGEECDEVQGYRYSKPVPAEQFMEFLEEYDGDLSKF